jgi:hypothetical protein
MLPAGYCLALFALGSDALGSDTQLAIALNHVTLHCFAQDYVIVDNHAHILLSIKNTLGIRNKSDHRKGPLSRGRSRPELENN